MALPKPTTSILKMNHKQPLAGKRTQASYQTKRDVFPIRRSSPLKFHSLPPSLLMLPTANDSSSSIDTTEQNNRSRNILSHLENETTLDEWLVRLDNVAKASEEERSTQEITRSVSRVSFASTPSSSTSSLSTSASIYEEPPKKRRRFARRNSFIVRDLAQLTGIPESVLDKNKTH